MILVCHMILQDHMINESCNFQAGAPHDKSPPSQALWPQVLW